MQQKDPQLQPPRLVDANGQQVNGTGRPGNGRHANGHPAPASRLAGGSRPLVLITGGAGFIGSHLADQLLEHGYRVRALDNLDPQVHGLEARRPDYLDERVQLVVGDVRDPKAVAEALEGVEIVVHFAAAVGVGQSMYALERYTSVNNQGTAVLLEALVSARNGGGNGRLRSAPGASVRKLLVASSMSIYGEGLYRDQRQSPVESVSRELADLRQHRWDPHIQGGVDAGRRLLPVPTPEWKRPDISSVYALGKYDQERMCLMVGGAYAIPTVAMRFFNVYGARQALSNPYTGVLAIFAGRLLNDAPPLVYEDGRQLRDFVHVRDIARGCRLAIESAAVDGQVVNLGSGTPRSVSSVARDLAAALGKDIAPCITGRYRVGDIRHCFADVSRARRLLGYAPQVSWESGLEELVEWVSNQQAADRTEAAGAELVERGLAV